LITKTLINQIEGEATLHFEIENKKVSFATVAFPHFRGMESILEGKKGLDALVITPRVCGICGHSHLFATVRAIEDAYKNAGKKVELTKKVQSIREFTLIMEMIQNHYKWLYLTILPSLSKLVESKRVQTPLKGAFASNLASKAIAIFAGQWPHSSYMVPGGITTDPTNMDILKVDAVLDELIEFFQKETLGIGVEEFLNFESCKEFEHLESDISFVEKSLIELKMQEKGFAYDRFLVIGKHNFSTVSKLKQTRPFSIDVTHVNLQDSYSPNQKTYAKNAQYKGLYYETGPLARAISSNSKLVKNMHRRFKDSAYSRVMARVFELATLLKEAKQLLQSIDISEASFQTPSDLSKISATGVGVVEAPRGPLMHTVTLERGVITHYEIITPTQFNIGSDTEENLTPAQKAMIGSSEEEASFIFKTYDVCSVCTTH